MEREVSEVSAKVCGIAFPPVWTAGVYELQRKILLCERQDFLLGHRHRLSQRVGPDRAQGP